MLTKPEHGWTRFHLEGTYNYQLSYLDDIAFDWLQEAIHGMKRLTPFCVKGMQEPGRMLCVVSYHNCWIISEEEAQSTRNEDPNRVYISPTSMIEFCEALYDDIKSYVDEWALFISTKRSHDHTVKTFTYRKRILLGLLDELKALIEKHRFRFENHCCPDYYKASYDFHLIEEYMENQNIIERVLANDGPLAHMSIHLPKE